MRRSTRGATSSSSRCALLRRPRQVARSPTRQRTNQPRPTSLRPPLQASPRDPDNFPFVVLGNKIDLPNRAVRLDAERRHDVQNLFSSSPDTHNPALLLPVYVPPSRHRSRRSAHRRGARARAASRTLRRAPRTRSTWSRPLRPLRPTRCSRRRTPTTFTTFKTRLSLTPRTSLDRTAAAAN